MNLHDRPTPRTNQIVREQLARRGITPTVLAAKLTMHSEQLEREAAAWQSVAWGLESRVRDHIMHFGTGPCLSCNALEAFDALREEVDG